MFSIWKNTQKVYSYFSKVITPFRSTSKLTSYKTKCQKLQRTGIIAIKVGMTQDWNNNGFIIPITILRIDDCQVFSHLTSEHNGYDALVLGACDRPYSSFRQVNASLFGNYLKQGIHPKYRLAEFKIDKSNFLPVGTILTARHFIPGQYVDCRSLTKEKGFCGVMKRWGFSGQPASHGWTKCHRRPGSSGSSGNARVFKGKKMPGHMGGKVSTAVGLKIFKIDVNLNLLFVIGSVPGHNNQFVYVRDSTRHPLPPSSFFPTYIEGTPYPLEPNEHGEIYQPDERPCELPN